MLICHIFCKRSHVANLIFEHTLNFVAHGFSAGGAEMYSHLVGGLADFLHKGRALCLRRGGGAGVDIGLFVAHRLSFR